MEPTPALLLGDPELRAELGRALIAFIGAATGAMAALGVYWLRKRNGDK